MLFLPAYQRKQQCVLFQLLGDGIAVCIREKAFSMVCGHRCWFYQMQQSWSRVKLPLMIQGVSANTVCSVCNCWQNDKSLCFYFSASGCSKALGTSVLRLTVHFQRHKMAVAIAICGQPSTALVANPVICWLSNQSWWSHLSPCYA